MCHVFSVALVDTGRANCIIEFNCHNKMVTDEFQWNLQRETVG